MKPRIFKQKNEKLWESRYKTNYDFETAIPQNVDGVGRKYIYLIRQFDVEYGWIFLRVTPYFDEPLGESKCK